jgi:hypothetical protein
MTDDITELRARLDSLESQHAVVAGFTAFLLKALVSQQPEAQRAGLTATFEAMFEQTIAGLLASERGYSDARVQAVESLRTAMFRAAP